MIHPFHYGVEVGLRREGFSVGAWRGRALREEEFLLILSPRFFPYWEKRRWEGPKPPEKPPALLLPKEVPVEAGKFELYRNIFDLESYEASFTMPWGYILGHKASNLSARIKENSLKGTGDIERAFAEILSKFWAQILPRRLEPLAPIPQSHLPLLTAAGFFPYTDLGEEGQVAVLPETTWAKDHPTSEFITKRDGTTTTVVTVRQRRAVRPRIFWKKGEEVVEL